MTTVLKLRIVHRTTFTYDKPIVLVQRGAPHSRVAAAPARARVKARDQPAVVEDAVSRLLGDRRHRLRGAAAAHGAHGRRHVARRSRGPAARARSASAGTASRGRCSRTSCPSTWSTRRRPSPPRTSRRSRTRPRARTPPTRRHAPSATTSTTQINYVPGVDVGAHARAGCVGRAVGRVPGLRAPRDRRPAPHRHPRSLCVRLPSPQPRRRSRRDGARRVPRVGRVVDGRLVRLRPHERQRGGRPPRHRGRAREYGTCRRCPGCSRVTPRRSASRWT